MKKRIVKIAAIGTIAVATALLTGEYASKLQDDMNGKPKKVAIDSSKQDIENLIREKEITIRRLESSMKAIKNGSVERNIMMEPGEFERTKKSIQKKLEAEKRALEEIKKANDFGK